MIDAQTNNKMKNLRAFMKVSDIENLIDSADDLSNLRVYTSESGELYYKSRELKPLFSEQEWRELTAEFTTSLIPLSNVI